MTVAAYALRCGVSPRSVRQWRRAGRLVLEPQTGLIRPDESDRLRAVTAQRIRTPRATAPPVAPAADPGEARLTDVLTGARLDPTQEKALLDRVRRLDIEARMRHERGEIATTKDIVKFWTDAAGRVQAALVQWADRSPELHAAVVGGTEHAAFLFMREAADQLLRQVAEILRDWDTRTTSTTEEPNHVQRRPAD